MRTKFDPWTGRLADRHRARAPRRRAVVPVGPHRRRHRPPRLRQDPRPAHPRPPRRPRRRPGHPHQGRRPAPHHHRPPSRRPARRRARPVRARHRPPRTRSGTPIAGCVDPMVAERRAKAFTAGTVRTAATRRLRRRRRPLLRRRSRQSPAGLLPRRRPHRRAPSTTSCAGSPTRSAHPNPPRSCANTPTPPPFWHGLLHGALTGDDRTAGNTITTVQQALSLFFQPDIRRRCIPGPGRPATDIADLIGRPRHHLPARPRRPLRVRVTADDRRRRTHPRHRPRPGQQQPVGTAVPTDAGLPGRTALHRTAADPADPDGQRTRAGDQLHLRRPDLAPSSWRSSAKPKPAP